MNSYFEQLELESIALESAIGAYEAENGLTEEYLNDFSTRYDYATEGAYVDDDDFGFGLFSDVSPATEASEGGGGIGKGIKNILSAVGRLFTKIKDGIVAFFQSFKKKKSEVKAEDVKVSPAAEQVATSLRGAIKNSLSIIKNVTVEDTTFIRDLCQKISDAIDAATKGVGNEKKTYLAAATRKKTQSDDEFTTARDEKFAKIGKTFRESYSNGSDEDASRATATKDLEAAEAILQKVKDTKESLIEANKKIKDIFAAELSKTIAKLNTETDKITSANIDSSSLSGKRDRAIADQGKQKDIDDYNAAQKKRAHLGNVTSKGTAGGVTAAKLVNQIKQKIFLDYDLNEINGLVGGVVTACKNNADFCKKIAEKKIETDNADAKIAYQMCKVLSNASTIYTSISASIKELISGNVFTYNRDGKEETFTDDNNNKYELNYGKRSDASKDEQDYLDE